MERDEFKSNIISNLNAAQRDAVEYCDGPQLVIACAGSGKTRVLTHKIAYLIASGLEPYQIMALTFTRKAAAEMKERINKLFGGQRISDELMMGTFHSVFARILRIEWNNAGLKKNFIIYDQGDSRNVINDIINSRLRRVKFYLTTSDMTLEDIAQQCGYHNQLHLIRQFKQHYGLTPTEYRKCR